MQNEYKRIFDDQFRSEGHANVAIITRTKDRGVTLRRAAQSVAAQSYDDYVWIVVNDGGEEAVVRDVLAECEVPSTRICVLSNAAGAGMESASNAGIAGSSSTFAVIHDDDDSWEPGFLARTVAFLEDPAHTLYGGVVVDTVTVFEEIRNGQIVEFSRQAAEDLPVRIELVEMLRHNLFSPIAFLFRRAVWEQVGGFNANYPVLGDWDFNLRFLLCAEIGLVHETLASYHVRVSAEGGSYANSVTAGKQLHHEYSSIVRNGFLRSAGEEDRLPVLTGLMGMSLHSAENERRKLEQRILAMAETERRQGQVIEEFCLATGSLLPDEAGQAAVRKLMSDFTAQRQAPEPSMSRHSQDDFDFLWATAHVNLQAAREKPGFAFARRKSRMVDPATRDWPDLEKAVAELAEGVPAPHDFDEAAYLQTYPDVAAAVAERSQASGYSHYLLHGRAEGRVRSGRHG